MTFDVASVKPMAASRSTRTVLLNNKVDIVNTLAAAICAAYNIKPYQLSSDGRWAGVVQSYYRIEGKPAGAATQDQLRAMLRALLAERFGLRVKTQTKSVRGYDLVVAKDGPKNLVAVPAMTHDADARQVGRGLTAAQFAWNDLAADASGYWVSAGDPGAEPVIDRTGLTGTYDFNKPLGHEGFAPAVAPDSDSPGGVEPERLTDLLNEKLGLKLVADKKVPLLMVSVLHVEKPTPD